LVNRPRVLLADEPTGDLDESNAVLVFDLLQRLHASYHLSSVVVTHNMDLAARCSRVLRLEGGRLVMAAIVSKPNHLEEIESGKSSVTGAK
jgi:lipoprotein-releasing system ATP-binding protein